jgi:hypothetical protein
MLPVMFFLTEIKAHVIHPNIGCKVGLTPKLFNKYLPLKPQEIGFKVKKLE